MAAGGASAASSQRKRATKSPATALASPASSTATTSTLSISDETDPDDDGDEDEDDALEALISDAAAQAAAQEQRRRPRRRRLVTRPTLRGALLGACFAWLLAALCWLRWPLYMQLVAEPLEKTLGAQLRAEVEPRIVVFALAAPFALTGALFYGLARVDSSGGGGDWRNAKWLLWLRRQRREYVGLGLDSVDAAAIALFLLVQLNCFVGKILIDQYTGKLAKKGLLSRAARSLGMNGLYAMILSILLVSRQSFVHKYLQLSSERAARYHVWSGNFGVLALVLHGVLYGVYWLQRGELSANLLPCTDCTTVLAYKTMRNFSGLVALVFLLVVALGSVEWMRRRHFRRFSLVHCLNVLFVVFSCVHYYPAAFWLVPPVLAYVVYRVVAFFGQGRATVISSASLSDKIVQLELRRAGGGSGDFQPGQYVYIKVDEISRTEWHPFTISSSPLKNRYALHLDAKVQGRFTRQLLEMIKAHRLTTVKVDGYYGSEIQPCAHMVFVAGGSGMTPFLSFLEHLQLRSERLSASSPSSSASTSSTTASTSSSSDQETDLGLFPETIWVVWTCRNVELLEAYAELLQSVKKSTRWKCNIWLHLTPSPAAEEIEGFECDDNDEDSVRVQKFFPSSMQRHAFSGGGALAAPLLTFVGACVGLSLAMQAVYSAEGDSIITQVWWLKRVLLLTASVVGAALGGSAVLLVQQLASRRASGSQDGVGGLAVTELEFAGLELSSPVAPQTPRKHASGGGGLASSVLLQRSFSVSPSRPDVRQRLRGIHSEVQENFGMSADVGLFVSGPASLQVDTARHARGLHSPLLAVYQKSFSV